jgi:DNA-binding Lrp family transcriptional regulator
MVEAEKRNLFWKDVEPLYAIQQEGKKYLSIVLNVKSMEAVHKVFLKNFHTLTSLKKTRTIPIMCPAYFPLPDGHPKGLERYMVYLRVAPQKYSEVYDKLLSLKHTDDTFLVYASHSFGDDDIIVSMLSKNRETINDFIKKHLGGMDGVNAYETSRVVNRISFLPKKKMDAHVGQFLFDAPAGFNGKRKNPAVYEKYIKERAPMTVIVRLYAKKSLEKLWADVEQNIQKFETQNIVPLYASQQEYKSYLTIIFETSNFEVLKDFMVDKIPNMTDLKKTRTIPLMDPTYFLMPKVHPKKLERYLITLRVGPGLIQQIRTNILGLDLPKNVFVTYLSYSLGVDDIHMSILAESRRAAQQMVKKAFDNMPGVESYDLSNQLRTIRLASKDRWKRHRDRFLSNYDKDHKAEYDTRYDWTDWSDDFEQFALMTGAFQRDMED